MKFARPLGALLIIIILAGCGKAQPVLPVPAAKPTPLPVPLAAQNTVFPPIARPEDNPLTAAKVELGRQLFFDPVLSASNAMSCATCHHPDLGFSNGAATSTPRPGAPGRNVMALWNSAFNRQLTWDGHVESLEEQALDPLTLPHEMAATGADVEARLRAIPAYISLFEAAFGAEADSISFVNVTRALAAFERTLIANHTPFDRYVAGETAALTPSQQRGMTLFFSERTNCSQCHLAPAFTQETFRVIGVPSDDPGRAGVSATGLFGAFKIPTLRNVALNAPYMHNGSLATLEDVAQFYADGAGRAQGFANVDPLLRGFSLTAEEKGDLVAFLRALTDESALPALPEQALSGLPTVPHIVNPAR